MKECIYIPHTHSNNIQDSKSIAPPPLPDTTYNGIHHPFIHVLAPGTSASEPAPALWSEKAAMNEGFMALNNSGPPEPPHSMQLARYSWTAYLCRRSCNLPKIAKKSKKSKKPQEEQTF
jgi:hypothetical protein